MYHPLTPCPSCARHVRTGERACPFCDAALHADHAHSIARDTTERLARSALVAFGAAVSLAACGPTLDETPHHDTVVVVSPPPRSPEFAQPPAPRDPRVVVTPVEPPPVPPAPPPVYGGPSDPGTSAPAYGIAPPRPPHDIGAPHALYGVPPRPPPIAQPPHDIGAPVALYGVPPKP